MKKPHSSRQYAPVAKPGSLDLRTLNLALLAVGENRVGGVSEEQVAQTLARRIAQLVRENAQLTRQRNALMESVAALSRERANEFGTDEAGEEFPQSAADTISDRASFIMSLLAKQELGEIGLGLDTARHCERLAKLWRTLSSHPGFSAAQSKLQDRKLMALARRLRRSADCS